MSKPVQMDIVLPQSPERVWRAITDSEALAQWLMPNDFRPRIGHRFRFTPKGKRKANKENVIQCEVVELDAPHRLAYTWRESQGSAPDMVTWVLEPVEAGTRLRLEHTRLMPVEAVASAACDEMSFPITLLQCIERLSHYLKGPRRSRNRVRGKVVLSTGSVFTCVAVSPYVAHHEEAIR